MSVYKKKEKKHKQKSEANTCIQQNSSVKRQKEQPEQLEKTTEQMTESRKRLRQTFYKRNKMSFATSIFCALLNSGLSVFVAYLLQMIIDAATKQSMDELTRAVWISAIYFVVFIINGFVMRGVKNAFIRRALKQYKEYAFRNMMKKSISSFANESTSTYISGLSNDINSIEENYLQASVEIAVQIFTFVAAIGMMLWYSVPMTIIAIVLSILPIIVSITVGGNLVEIEKRVSDGNESFVGMVKDMLNGFTVVKSFKAESEVETIFVKRNDNIEGEKFRRRKKLDLVGIISGTSGILVQIVVFSSGAYLAIKGKISIGVVIAFVQLMNYVLAPISSIPALFAKRAAALGLVNKLADELEDNKNMSGNVEKQFLEKGIACENISFGYEPDKLVLNNVSLKFENGKSYAIVGSSGSGKSTLLNLLLGGYTGYEGRIMFDDVELKDVSDSSLYDLLSIIQQNVFIFDSSVQENITMFKEFDEKQVERAIEKSGLKTFIQEKGAGYQCGENGVGLSGGERQRISIARCLLRNTPVLLMDEATASLDNATSYMVEDAILKIDDMLRIVVTHKLQEIMLRRYDQIIVFKEGSVIEKGTYDELMGNQGYFYSLMCISQSTNK